MILVSVENEEKVDYENITSQVTVKFSDFTSKINEKFGSDIYVHIRYACACLS